ncbi:hypothetical protein BBJ28_00021202 [Nothophytophthora sp. Chile5]|nr:hypothetical protein BBJ28_00021202 [Nothophytophthora sp. Chile5]
MSPMSACVLVCVCVYVFVDGYVIDTNVRAKSSDSDFAPSPRRQRKVRKKREVAKRRKRKRQESSSSSGGACDVLLLCGREVNRKNMCVLNSAVQDVDVLVEPFGLGRIFKSWDELEVAWKVYLEQNMMTYRKRTSLKSSTNNRAKCETIVRRTEDNACMVMKAADNAVCGVMMINAAQKAIYAKWGECLLFDWTHNTNNLGFYLGELMVTAGNGKGVSVCEMLVVNQKKETMQHCLQFFKDTIGRNITETFVIDKDLTEWRVLEEVYPHAKVLLCQFHALMAVKKKVSAPMSNIPPRKREVLEADWHHLIYADTIADFERDTKTMARHCKKISSGFQTYLERNCDVKALQYSVSFESHSCECRHFDTTRLPCVHVMIAMLEVKKAEFLTPDIISARWNYASARTLVPVLKETAQMNKRMRDLSWSAARPSVSPGVCIDGPTPAASVVDVSTLEVVEVERNDIRSPDVIRGDLRLVDMKLPPPIHAGKKNNTRRRGSTKKMKQPRPAVSLEVDQWNNGVPVEDVTEWLRRITDFGFAGKVLKKYPPVFTKRNHIQTVPKVFGAGGSAVKALCVIFHEKVLEKCKAALTRAYKKPKIFPPTTLGYELQLTGKTRYHQSLIQTMGEFYEAKQTYVNKTRTYEWLKSDWDALEGEAVESLTARDGQRATQMAIEVTNVLNFTLLTAYASVPLVGGGVASVPISEIISVVPRTQWLSDSPIMLMLQKMCAEHGNAACIGSLVSTSMSWHIPVDVSLHYDCLVTPVNHGRAHWTLVLIDLKSAEVTIYDPMESPTWISMTRERVESVVIPAVDEWRANHFALLNPVPEGEPPLSPPAAPSWKDPVTHCGPRQGDSDSCGVLVVAMARCFLHNEMKGFPRMHLVSWGKVSC